MYGNPETSPYARLEGALSHMHYLHHGEGRFDAAQELFWTDLLPVVLELAADLGIDQEEIEAAWREGRKHDVDQPV